MARFRYSLQSILNIKLKMESQAKQEFSAARSRLDEEEQQLRVLLERRQGYEARAKELLAGRLNVMEIEENRNAILAMDDYIAAQQDRVRLAEIQLEEAREKLMEVTKERKTHETLRDKAFEEFVKEENRLEGKAIDELTSYTYGRKRQVKN